MEKQELVLTFQNALGKPTYFRPKYFKPGLTEENVKPVMDKIVSLDRLFYKKDKTGKEIESYVKVVGAKYVNKTVAPIFGEA